MKTLIAYYSRTGTTRKVAEEISKQLNADIEEIIDLKNRKGAIGYIISGKDATLKKLTKIKELKKDPKDYDIVVIGTPVWAFSMAPAVRMYLKKAKIKKVALFSTFASSKGNIFSEMKKLLPGTKILGHIGIVASDIKNKTYIKKIKEFVSRVKG